MRDDVLNKNSGSYGNIPDLYPKGFSAVTADFTAVDGYIYLGTLVTGLDITLPVPTYGARIKIVVGAVTSGTHTITTDASTTLFEGYALLGDEIDGTAAHHIVFAADESDDRVLTMDGTTTGNGGTIELFGLSDNRWRVEALLYASGAVATPFS